MKFDYLLTAKDSALLKEGFQHIASFDSFAGVEIVDYRISLKTKKAVFLMRNGNHTVDEI